MATTFQILRINQTTKNDELYVFVDTQIYDSELGIINYAKWYTGELAASIVQDPTAARGLIEQILPAILASKRQELFNPSNLITVQINSLHQRETDGAAWTTEVEPITGFTRGGWTFDYAVEQAAHFSISNNNGSVFNTNTFKIKLFSKIPILESQQLEQGCNCAVWKIKSFFENQEQSAQWSEPYTVTVAYAIGQVVASDWVTVTATGTIDENSKLVVEISREVSNESDLLDRSTLLTGIDLVINQ